MGMDLMTALAQVSTQMPEEGEVILEAVDDLVCRLDQTLQALLRMNRRIQRLAEHGAEDMKRSQEAPPEVAAGSDPLRNRASAQELRARLAVLPGGRGASAKPSPALTLVPESSRADERGKEDDFEP